MDKNDESQKIVLGILSGFITSIDLSQKENLEIKTISFRALFLLAAFLWIKFNQRISVNIKPKEWAQNCKNEAKTAFEWKEKLKTENNPAQILYLNILMNNSIASYKANIKNLHFYSLSQVIASAACYNEYNNLSSLTNYMEIISGQKMIDL